MLYPLVFRLLLDTESVPILLKRRFSRRHDTEETDSVAKK